ncbi:BTAD domain-containing putative transcriptional regulator [Herbiconiux sp.]|uniref:AfsR/SARP family transcriptional regulator n=1 Tax=Herbiconiux sp. TaxID=1871186 RepID=UPI0025B83852|nr:BTAD domain-containing putative transcriptional regulator [Herbiconiux sp.]
MSEIQGTSDDRVRVAVLGPVAVRNAADELVEPAGQRGKALIVALALASPRPVSGERLTDDIWGDEPPRGARAALQTLVSRIRSSLGDDLIESLPSGYRLAVPGDTIDLLRGERLLAEARDVPAAIALAATQSALRLWRGDPGADLAAPALADALRERADHARAAIETVRATAALDSGQPTIAEEIARTLCRRSPFDDSAHLLLMRALDALGRSTEAVSVYADFRRRVQDAFGTSPDRDLQQLNLELLDREAAEPVVGVRAGLETGEGTEAEARYGVGPGVPPVGPFATGPVTPSRDESPRLGIGIGIRAAPNALIGRDEAVAALMALLRTARITTVLGPGGLGKTRIAHEIARRSLAHFGAVVVVELASVRSADDIVFALATALGIRELGSSRRLGDPPVRADLRPRILARLGATPTLLVLDNCEHLIDAAADWCVGLTDDLPELTILTTSRTPLAVSSERVYTLQPLGERLVSDPAGPGATPTSAFVPATTDDAVTLFLDRATAARPDAVLPPDTVAALCARLDGLPLAIELAAARIRTMSIDEIGRRLSNRFALLSGGDRSAPERHRTLRAVIEWSWNLLGTAEQRALARLSEFADGFSADAAATVVDVAERSDVESLLDGLVAQSLVMVRETRAGLRYRMLETVREFGRLQLGERGDRDAAVDALFSWADEFARRRASLMDGPTQVPTFVEIAAEEDNLIDVLRRALDAQHAVVATSIFSLLSYYWTLRSAHTEVLAFSKPVFQVIRGYRPSADRVEQYAAALLVMTATTMITEPRFGVRPFSRLRKLAREHPLAPSRLATMVDVLLSATDQTDLLARVDIAIESPDKATALVGTLIASVSAENDGDRVRAIAMARSAARLAGALDDTWGDAMASQMLASLYSQGAESEEALRWARRARAGLDRLGAADDIRQLDWTVATNALALGDLEEAEELFEQITRLPGETDGIDYRSIGLSGQAEVLRARGRLDASLSRQLAAIASFDSPRRRASPWYRMLLSATLTCAVVDATASHDVTTALARRSRSRSLAVMRANPYVDRPVLGASLIGLAVWLEDLSFRTGIADAATALEVLCLAEALSARQDSPALHLAPLFERFARSTPADEIAAMRASVSALPDDEKPARTRQLLGARGPWSWPVAGQGA